VSAAVELERNLERFWRFVDELDVRLRTMSAAASSLGDAEALEECDRLRAEVDAAVAELVAGVAS